MWAAVQLSLALVFLVSIALSHLSAYSKVQEGLIRLISSLDGVTAWETGVLRTECAELRCVLASNLVIPRRWAVIVRSWRASSRALRHASIHAPATLFCSIQAIQNKYTKQHQWSLPSN